jgi:uncharacterized membrane protein YkvA (DUF1232 family)
MRQGNRRAATVDRIATVATAAVAALILAMFALTAKSATHATLAETTAAMAYLVGPLVSKAIGRIPLPPRSTTKTGR